MLKRILSTVLVLSILFSTFSRPVKADSEQPHFTDLVGQLGIKRNRTLCILEDVSIFHVYR